MKKVIVAVMAFLFLASCGPKRMTCYGKRCVEVSIKSHSKEKMNLKENIKV